METENRGSSYQNDRVKLSASSLSVFRDCARCFYFDKRFKSPRPRGIFPSLPGGMDLIIKKKFDQYRFDINLAGTQLAEQFKNLHVTLYREQENLDRFRNWRTGLTYIDSECGFEFIGALDDLMVEVPSMLHVPFDYKTKGSPTTLQSAVRYYQSQLDIYSLLLEANGMKVAGYGILAFFSPKEICSRVENIQFEVQLIKVPTDFERAKNLLRSAADCLKSNEIPRPSATCEYCAFVSKRKGALNEPSQVNQLSKT